jgi:hypothetical protein
MSGVPNSILEWSVLGGIFYGLYFSGICGTFANIITFSGRKGWLVTGNVILNTANFGINQFVLWELFEIKDWDGWMIANITLSILSLILSLSFLISWFGKNAT